MNIRTICIELLSESKSFAYWNVIKIDWRKMNKLNFLFIAGDNCLPAFSKELEKA